MLDDAGSRRDAMFFFFGFCFFGLLGFAFFGGVGEKKKGGFFFLSCSSSSLGLPPLPMMETAWPARRRRPDRALAAGGVHGE